MAVILDGAVLNIAKRAKQKTTRLGGFCLAPPAGLEPATSWLTVMRSTDWAKEEYAAPSGTRTRDPLIKSQLLYQLS